MTKFVLHTGGIFDWTTYADYIRGTVVETNQDLDDLNYLNMLHFCRSVGYTNVDYIHFRNQRLGLNLKGSLRLVYNEESIASLLQLTFDKRNVDIYVENGEDVHPLLCDLNSNVVCDKLAINAFGERKYDRIEERASVLACSNTNLNKFMGVNMHSIVLSGVSFIEVIDGVEIGLEDINLGYCGEGVNASGDYKDGALNFRDDNGGTRNDSSDGRNDNVRIGEEHWVNVLWLIDNKDEVLQEVRKRVKDFDHGHVEVIEERTANEINE